MPARDPASASVPAPVPVSPRVLVFSRTTGYRHESIPAGVAALREVCAADGIDVDATEDATRFLHLDGYAAVVFLSASGTVLDGRQRAAFAGYLRAGGGFAGVHAASTAEGDWPFYGHLVGASFTRHPEIQPATLRVEDRDHPATAHLGGTWRWVDEWYDFAADPRPRVRVLLSVDESTYSGGGMGVGHPIAWCHEIDWRREPFRDEPVRDRPDRAEPSQGRPGRAGARSFYTALGHTSEAYQDPAFRAHLRGGVRYATGLA